MARRADSVVGIDLGKHMLKGVALRRKNDTRFVLTSFASRPVPEEFASADDLARELKQLIRDLGGAKACAFAVSDPSTILRIIEQPDTPAHLLRNALRLNGLAVLNQDCKEFVLDVAPLITHQHGTSAIDKPAGDGSQRRPCKVVSSPKPNIWLAECCAARLNKLSPQLPKSAFRPKCFNSRRSARSTHSNSPIPKFSQTKRFFFSTWVTLQSTVLIGSRSELILVRSIDYGGKALMQALTAEDALDADAAWLMIQQGDEGMTEICRNSLARLAMEVRNSIGFFEGQREEGINRIFVSGGLARAETVLQILSDELSLPCEIWDPLETCEVALPAAKRQSLPNEFISLNVACGAAFEYLKQ